MELPNEVVGDLISDNCIQIFVLANRQRRYIDGIALPLSVRDISDVCDHYRYYVPRWLLDAVVFALDDIWLDSFNKKSKR